MDQYSIIIHTCTYPWHVTLVFVCSNYYSLFRFYNKLPEVKKQREEEQRKKTYSTNRDKAKEYQEVHAHNMCMM